MATDESGCDLNAFETEAANLAPTCCARFSISLLPTPYLIGAHVRIKCHVRENGSKTVLMGKWQRPRL